ncbi:MAG: ABC transporter ATP-binding protein [Solirubrobacteraceae bacterium]
MSVRELVKRFGSGPAQVTALDGVDIEIEAGAAVALMGPSGSGKSTLLHLIGAMDLPTSGSVRVGDVDVDRLEGAAAAKYRSRLGFVFQGFHLLGALSAIDNVLVPTLPSGRSNDYETEAQDLLERVGLGDRLDALPSQLSGGQQQRVAIARALVGDPDLLLADEPTGNLDSATGSDVTELLLTLREERGTTLLLATHNPAIAGHLDRVFRLADGKAL